MKLSIYSLKKVLFEGEAESVNCKTVSGEITILNHHLPLISMLAEGTITITDAQKKEHFVPVKSGFVEVNSDNQVKIIAEATQ